MTSNFQTINPKLIIEAQTIDPKSKIRQDVKFLIEKVILNVVLVSFIMGYSVVYFNAIKFEDLMEILNTDFDKAFAQGFFTSCVPASACIGALLSSFFLKIFTRKQFFYIINAMCISGILLIQTRFLILIVLGRLLQGCLVGIGTAIVPLYIKEFIPEINGKYGLYNQLFFTIGVVWGFLFNLILHWIYEDSTIYWRWIFAFPLPLCLIQAYMVSYHYNFQTPRYLVSVNRNDEAKDLLQKIYKQEFVQEQYKVLYQAVHSKSSNQESQELGEWVSGKNMSVEKLQTLKNQPCDKKFAQVSQSNTLTDSLIQSAQPSNNPLAVFCALHLSFQQQIVGIGAVIVYSGDIIKEIIPSLFYSYAVIVHLIGLCCVILGIFLIKKFGRVILLQVGAGIISICLLIMGVNFLLGENKLPWMVGLAVVVLRGTFSATLGPITWLYMAEIVKPNIIPYGTFINWTIATLVMFLYPILSEKLGGPEWIFLLNSFMCIITMLINALTLIETKNKNQLTIKQDFDIKLENLKKRFHFTNLFSS